MGAYFQNPNILRSPKSAVRILQWNQENTFGNNFLLTSFITITILDPSGNIMSPKVEFDTVIRGHHVYKTMWAPENLICGKDKWDEAKE